MLNPIAVPELAGRASDISGLDQRSKCLDKEHFDQYPYQVTYNYNSRGFRDQEWPSDLESAIWCLGDSFTAGLGSPIEHTWPSVLSQRSQHQTINVSMDGASNNWIARRCVDVYDLARPKNIVIMWSYLHRRESPESGSDLSRRMQYTGTTLTQDIENLAQCRQQVQQHCANSNIVEFIIPDWHPAVTPTRWNQIRDPSWPDRIDQLTESRSEIFQELAKVFQTDLVILRQQLLVQQQFASTQLNEVVQQDWARDGHHFDIVTAGWVADQAVSNLVW